MTEEQIYNICKALLADTKVHLKASRQDDGSLMSKARLVLFKPEEDGDYDGDVDVQQAHGRGAVNSI